MRYGFKAQAERMAVEARAALGLRPTAPFDAVRYAAHCGIVILDFDTLAIPEASKHILISTDAESWSGMTIREGKLWAIVLNPSHSDGRRANTLMHELSHIILEHLPVRVNVSAAGLLVLSDFSEDQESEADWLSGATLLPRDALYEKRTKGRSEAQIASDMGVSIELVKWRLRMTGIDMQIKRSRAKK